MKPKIIYAIVGIASLFMLPSCDDCADVDCVYGICEDGYCDCFSGYYGDRCQYKSNSSTCNYTQYTGTGSCSSGYYPVGNGKCCSIDYPYHCPNNGKCYTTCEAADAACSGTINKANLSGGSSSGYNCSGGSCTYVNNGASYSSLSSCQSSCGGGNTSGYICAGGSCSYVSSGATYSSLSSCQTNCVSSTGQLMIYNKNSQPCSAGAGTTISVYVNGSYVGGLSTYYTSEPSCGASGAITKTYSPGTYSVSATCGTNTWPAKSIQVYAGGCSKFYLQ